MFRILFTLIPPDLQVISNRLQITASHHLNSIQKTPAILQQIIPKLFLKDPIWSFQKLLSTLKFLTKIKVKLHDTAPKSQLWDQETQAVEFLSLKQKNKPRSKLKKSVEIWSTLSRRSNNIDLKNKRVKTSF